MSQASVSAAVLNLLQSAGCLAEGPARKVHAVLMRRYGLDRVALRNNLATLNVFFARQPPHLIGWLRSGDTEQLVDYAILGELPDLPPLPPLPALEHVKPALTTPPPKRVKPEPVVVPAAPHAGAAVAALTTPPPKRVKPEPVVVPAAPRAGAALPRAVAAVAAVADAGAAPRLFPYQTDAVQWLVRGSGGVLAFEMGTGKTLVAVAAAEALRRQDPMRPVVVVLPKTLHGNFQDTLVRYGVAEPFPGYAFYTYEGFTVAFVKDRTLGRGAVLICDEAHALRTDIYKALRVHLPSAAAAAAAATADVDVAALRDFIKVQAAEDFSWPIEAVQQRFGLDLLPHAPRALVVLMAARRASHRILLTATPCYNSTYDLANLACLVRGDGVMSRRYFKTLSPAYFRGLLRFQPIAPGDPDFARQEEFTVELPMSDEYYRQYREVEQANHVAWGQPWQFYSGVRQGTLGLPGNPKVEWCVRRVQEATARNQRCLVFSAFLGYGLCKVQEQLTAVGIPWTEITGQTATVDRTAAVSRFNAGGLVLMVSAAGGEGIDLKGCEVVIIMEAEFNAPRESQVAGRGVRRHAHDYLPLARRVVTVYRLILVKPLQRAADDKHARSADEILQALVTRKQAEIVPFLKRLQ